VAATDHVVQAQLAGCCATSAALHVGPVCDGRAGFVWAVYVTDPVSEQVAEPQVTLGAGRAPTLGEDHRCWCLRAS